METGSIIGLLGVVGAGSLIYGYRLLSSTKEGEPSTNAAVEETDDTFIAGEPMPPGLKLEEQEASLKMLSTLWRDGKVKEMRFDQLAKIWRKVEVKVEAKVRVPVFLHEDITRFYLDRVRGRPYFVGDALDATLDLLELLDKEGNCSSVVRMNEKESEKIYDADTYNTLAQVPLFRHSVNVACAAMDKVGKGSIVPKAAIAALAHDLGKIPYYYGKYYKTSAHPMVGMSVAETIPSVKGIKWWDEISAAIKNHHGQSAEYLDALIREADQAARRFEMNNPGQQAAEPEQEQVAVQRPEPLPEKFTPRQPLPAASAPIATVQKPVPAALDPKPAAPVTPIRQEPTPQEPKGQLPSATPPVEPERPERKRVPRQPKDISAWFEPERFVRELSKIINTTQTGDKFWSALALGGYVYVKPVGFYGLVVRHSKHNPEVVTAGASEQDRDDFLYSVVMELKKLKDLVATEFLSGDRFGAVFLHNPGGEGAGSKQFLIPFRADYFGEEIARAESRRNTLMKKTVALAPAFNKGGN